MTKRTETTPLGELKRRAYRCNMRAAALEAREYQHPQFSPYIEVGMRVKWALSAIKRAVMYRQLAQEVKP